MQRRFLLLAAAALPLPPALAHHGWSSFDQGRPVYLAGTARKVAWRNPHVEFDLEVAPDLRLPADLARRPVPAQSSPVDGAGLLARAELPRRKDKVWHIECAPLTRMEAWKVAEIRNGDAVAMVGFTFAGEQGEAILRVEYLFVGAASYGLRSSPA
ncbi:DUF6152 family protein [uncultured Methylibium sp.]|uniref:DUF6152 family protein n=1 Tax=uncultured Methylibium sp. TaxID=381093 RepID=UPI0025D68BFB|nr:DUF6152 family protein [uncultured Methylibium sp.]